MGKHHVSCLHDISFSGQLLKSQAEIMENDITQRINRYISESILKQTGRHIQPNEKLISSGLIDSFSLVDLALYIEDSFGVRIDDTELNADTFDTLEELAKLIQTRSA